MKIRVGFEITYDFVARTPMMLMLNVHPSRAADVIKPDQLRVSPAVPFTRYLDAFGNVCTRLVAPPGQLEIFTDALVADSGLPDPVEPAARQHEVAELPHDALVFLLASRYCETERLMEAAWSLLRPDAAGLGAGAGDLRLRPFACALRLSARARHQDRDRRHHRAPRRLPRLRPPGDHALPLHEHPGALLHRLPRRHRRAAEPDPMDFSAWFEVYLGGRWYTFDARHNKPRIGRILMARGRDAADVAIHHHLRAEHAPALRRAYRRGASGRDGAGRAQGGVSHPPAAAIARRARRRSATAFPPSARSR